MSREAPRMRLSTTGRPRPATATGAAAPSRGTGLASAMHARIAVLLAPVAAIAIAIAAFAQPPADVLPYRLAFGRPIYSPETETAAYLWIQGGRIRLRFATDGSEHRFTGELRTDREGIFEDVMPTGENVRIRQLRPGKILFDARGASGEDGLDVTLGGSFDQLTVDLHVDGEQRADLLRIGEEKRTPAALPARLELRKATSAWIERFGF